MKSVYQSVKTCRNVINICITEVQTVGNFVYEALKSLSSVFRSPNVIKGNSKSPNGVVMAVLHISSGLTGI